MNETLQTISDAASSPPIATATTVAVTTANLLDFSLPIVINIATVIYLSLLISHKGWQMYKEWKQGRSREPRE